MNWKLLTGWEFAHLAQIKWKTVSDSLRSLRGNERWWANRSGRSPKMSKWVNRSFFWANRSFAYFWAKNEWFARKTDKRISSPASNWSKCRCSLCTVDVLLYQGCLNPCFTEAQTNINLDLFLLFLRSRNKHFPPVFMLSHWQRNLEHNIYFQTVHSLKTALSLKCSK